MALKGVPRLGTLRNDDAMSELNPYRQLNWRQSPVRRKSAHRKLGHLKMSEGRVLKAVLSCDGRVAGNCEGNGESELVNELTIIILSNDYKIL